jgi:hypothetical protein
MKHTVTEKNKVKTFEIGDTDMLSGKIIVPPVSDYLSTLEKSYGKSNVYKGFFHKVWSKVLNKFLGILHIIKIP